MQVILSTCPCSGCLSLCSRGHGSLLGSQPSTYPCMCSVNVLVAMGHNKMSTPHSWTCQGLEALAVTSLPEYILPVWRVPCAPPCPHSATSRTPSHPSSCILFSPSVLLICKGYSHNGGPRRDSHAGWRTQRSPAALSALQSSRWLIHTGLQLSDPLLWAASLMSAPWGSELNAHYMSSSVYLTLSVKVQAVPKIFIKSALLCCHKTGLRLHRGEDRNYFCRSKTNSHTFSKSFLLFNYIVIGSI